MSGSDQEGAIQSASLVVPRGRVGLAPIYLDMTEVYRIEKRIQEIKIADPLSMPDLISDFNYGFVLLGKMIATIELELAEAKMSLQESRSIVMLDKVDKILAEKGILKSSTDLRDAVVTLDPSVKEANQKVAILQTYAELLYNKSKAMEMAYHGSKEVSKTQARIPDSNNYGGRR